MAMDRLSALVLAGPHPRVIAMANLSDLSSSAFWRVNPKDPDPRETGEWLEAFDALIESEGRERATYLLRRLLDHAKRSPERLGAGGEGIEPWASCS